MNSHNDHGHANGREWDSANIRLWSRGNDFGRSGVDAERAAKRTEAKSSLSPDDQQSLESFEKDLQLVRDRTASVVLRYQTGFFLWGPGGVSKSFTVVQELQQMQAYYRISNSRMTGRGLFDTLTNYPDAIHVLEDVEQMMSDKNALGVLRSALWGQCGTGDQGPQERWITWTAHRAQLETLFTGGIIVISNRPLVNLPELQALGTRFPPIELRPTDNELRAMMRYIAALGYCLNGKSMDAAECREVCEHVMTESLSLHRSLDIRLLINAFSCYLQWSEGDSGCHWTDQVAALVRQRATTFRADVFIGSRAERKEQELAIAREIRETTSGREECLRLWKEKTGKSPAVWYRRLKDLGRY